jgi:leucyl aminopeptidase
MLRSALTLLLGASQVGLSYASPDSQVVLGPLRHVPETYGDHIPKDAVLAAIERYSDPVDAMVSLRPDAAIHLDQPRLLRVFGEEKAEWMTEGDKLRLRKEGKKFMDITDHHDFYAQQVDSFSGKASKFILKHIRQTLD